MFSEKTSKNDCHVIKSSPEIRRVCVFSLLDLLIFCCNFSSLDKSNENVFNNILYIFLFPNIKIRKTQKKVLNLVSTFLTISNNFVSTFDFYKFVIRYEKDFYPITRDKINIRFACKSDEKNINANDWPAFIKVDSAEKRIRKLISRREARRENGRVNQ